MGVALFVGAVEGSRLTFLSKKQKNVRRGKPLVTQVNAFATREEACCACFKSKYAWPANAGLGAAFAPKQTCDTCYVADIYGIDAKAPVVFGVPTPSSDNEKGVDGCTDRCDILNETNPFCQYVYVPDGGGEKVHKKVEGPGACKQLINDPLFNEQMLKGTPAGTKLCDGIMGLVCPTSCGKPGCGAYTQTESKVEAVHEWNWNCASGNAPEDAAEWLLGPVEGEPESARGPFLQCQEDKGWFCPFDDGPDLRMRPQEDKPEEIEEGGGDQALVSTMTLPVIDGAMSAAASATP